MGGGGRSTGHGVAPFTLNDDGIPNLNLRNNRVYSERLRHGMNLKKGQKAVATEWE